MYISAAAIYVHFLGSVEYHVIFYQTLSIYVEAASMYFHLQKPFKCFMITQSRYRKIQETTMFY